MITRRKKICDGCTEEKFIFSHGLCLQCWKVLHGKRIPPIAEKQKERHQQYEELRDQYLNDHPKCEVCKAKAATEIHHKRGRIGNNLFKDFLAVDRECHRRIEENPDWAREQGFILSRI